MENSNSCCFVGRIQEIKPIEGADKIVQAIISNYECVITKDSFRVGDLVVIAVTDAIIPIPLAEKLGIVNYLKNRKKTGQLTVKTTKLRGVYSMATIIQEASMDDNEWDDMMSRYGIFKYEEPEKTIQLANGKKIRAGKHEAFHIYYKFPNIKNAPNMFSPEDVVKVTRKVHGCNARYGIVKKSKITILDRLKKLFGNKLAYYDYVYGSHQVEKGVNSVHFYESDVWAEIGNVYDIENSLRKWAKEYANINKLDEGIIIYGEIYGQGIQKYYDYNTINHRFAIFDIKINGEYIPNFTFEGFSKRFGLPIVDKYYEGKYNEEEIKKWQFGRYIPTSSPNKKIPEEGVVVSSTNGDRNKIAKFINPEYLEFQSKKEDSTDFH